MAPIMPLGLSLALLGFAAFSIETLVMGEFRRVGQDAIERLYGLSRFHRVDVALRPVEAAAPRGTPTVPTSETQLSPTRDAGAVATGTSSQ